MSIENDIAKSNARQSEFYRQREDEPWDSACYEGAVRGVHCSRCGAEHVTGELDSDDFDADLEELGWTVPDEGMRFEGGVYHCPNCKKD